MDVKNGQEEAYIEVEYWNANNACFRQQGNMGPRPQIHPSGEYQDRHGKE